MTTSVETIADLYAQRKADQGPSMARLRAIRDMYNGDLIVALAGMDSNEPSSVANLFKGGIDQLAMRIGGVLPNVEFPVIRPGVKRSEELARTRKRATLGWWESNHMEQKLAQRARHLIGYASSPVVLCPDRKKGIARWEVRDPLTTYAASMNDPLDLTPENVIFSYPRSLKWITDRYPLHARQIERGYNPQPGDRFDLLEYVDGDETVLVLLGKAPKDNGYSYEPSGQRQVELERVPNRTGMSPAVIPGAITLDRRQSQFEGLLQMYAMQARLMALEVIAVEKGIFPDMFLESNQGETAQLLGGTLKDGRTGEINTLKGGKYVERSSTPGQMTNVIIDRLERNMRVTAGVSADLGGESGSNIRTGKRGQDLLSAVTDFPVAEAQKMLASSMQEENKVAVAIAKAYFGNAPKRFYVTTKGAKGNVDYVPNEVFEDDNNIVKFSGGGSDVNSMVIGAGQRVGMQTLSKRGFMDVDPMIDDPETESDRITAEGIEAAVLSGFQTQVASGAIPVSDAARVQELVVSDRMSLFEAILKVQKEAQERQAEQVAPEDPAAQPGLASVGMGAEAGIAPIEEPAQGSQNLSALLSSLRSPQRTLPSERVA